MITDFSRHTTFCLEKLPYSMCYWTWRETMCPSHLYIAVHGMSRRPQLILHSRWFKTVSRNFWSACQRQILISFLVISRLSIYCIFLQNKRNHSVSCDHNLSIVYVYPTFFVLTVSGPLNCVTGRRYTGIFIVAYISICRAIFSCLLFLLVLILVTVNWNRKLFQRFLFSCIY